MASNFLDPIKHINGAIIKRIVASGQTIVVGKMAKFGSYDDEVSAGGSNDETNAFVCVGPGAPGTSYTAADVVELVPVTSGSIVPCAAVGTVTRGKAVKYTTGFVDADDAAGSGTSEIPIWGVAMQSGVNGDYVGIALCRAERII